MTLIAADAAMNRYDQYFRYAQEAQRQADRAKGDRKEAWLRLASGWLSLLPRRLLDGMEGKKADGQLQRDCIVVQQGLLSFREARRLDE
jgi:hypothetical protein